MFNTTFFAVSRLEPNGNLFLTFTCITTATTKGNIFSSDNFLIVNNVLPTSC